MKKHYVCFTNVREDFLNAMSKCLIITHDGYRNAINTGMPKVLKYVFIRIRNTPSVNNQTFANLRDYFPQNPVRICGA